MAESWNCLTTSGGSFPYEISTQNVGTYVNQALLWISRFQPLELTYNFRCEFSILNFNKLC
jgi:hypothetical protein